MTLLEILVQAWSVWRGGSRCYQDADGHVISSEGYCFRYDRGRMEIASDRATAVVTEAKWRAAKGERDA